MDPPRRIYLYIEKCAYMKIILKYASNSRHIASNLHYSIYHKKSTTSVQKNKELHFCPIFSCFVRDAFLALAGSGWGQN
jgi:hypothetical protein